MKYKSIKYQLLISRLGGSPFEYNHSRQQNEIFAALSKKLWFAADFAATHYKYYKFYWKLLCNFKIIKWFWNDKLFKGFANWNMAVEWSRYVNKALMWWIRNEDGAIVLGNSPRANQSRCAGVHVALASDHQARHYSTLINRPATEYAHAIGIQQSLALKKNCNKRFFTKDCRGTADRRLVITDCCNYVRTYFNWSKIFAKIGKIRSGSVLILLHLANEH